MMTTNEMIMYDYIVEAGIATADEINLVRNLVSGSWETVLNDVLYVRTGYRTLEQLWESEEEDDEVETSNPYEVRILFI